MSVAHALDDVRYSPTDFEKTVDAEKDAIASKDEEQILEAIVDFDDPNLDREGAIAGVLEDDSPYPEVRSAVANTDDPEVPCSTLRAWIMGKHFNLGNVRSW